MSKSRYNSGINISVVLLIVGFTFLIVGSIFEISNKVVNERVVVGCVTDKEVKRTGDSSDKYLIYTELENGDVAVYEITDSLLKGRFNSSDLYAKIKTGHTYKFTICGERYHFLSMYPNIYSAVEITDETDSE